MAAGLYREIASGFTVIRDNPGAGYVAISAMPADRAGRAGWWRAVDLNGQASSYHPSDEPTAAESAAPTVDYGDVTGTKPPPDATRNKVWPEGSTFPTTGIAAGDTFTYSVDGGNYTYNGTVWVLTSTRNVAWPPGSAFPPGAKAGDTFQYTVDSGFYVCSGPGAWTKVSDVTAANIAAGFSGQGPFATLAQILASNIDTYIADLAIGTLKLAAGAVTWSAGAATAGSPVNVSPGGSPTTILTINAPANANRGPMHISAHISLNVTASNAGTLTIYAYRGGTFLTSVPVSVGASEYGEATLVFYDTSPGTAAVTYYIKCVHTLSTSPAIKPIDGGAWIAELKR